MERSIAANNPADSGAWATLRNQYGNMKVLSKASLGGGEDAGLGVISPARLRMAASGGNALETVAQAAMIAGGTWAPAELQAHSPPIAMYLFETRSPCLKFFISLGE